MNARLTSHLPEPLARYLQAGCPAILITRDEGGYPHTAFTWVAAPDDRRLRFGVDHGGTTLGNLERDGRAALQVAGPGNLVFLVKGSALKVKDQIEATEIPMAMFEMEPLEARDQSWPPVTVAPLQYHWPAELEKKMRTVEQAVYRELAA